MQTRYISNGSAAYDLEKFGARQKMRIKKPSLTVSASKKAVKTKANIAGAFKLAASIVLVVGIVITMLYSRAVLTEMNQKLNAMNVRLNEEKSEFTRLSAQLESKISLRNVEEYATQTLGMSPMDKHQITYVELSEGDRIELTSQSPKQTVFDRISIAINNVQEYIGND